MTLPTTAPARGACRVCRQRQRLDADGRIVSHDNPQLPGIECDGTSRLPAGDAR